MKKIFLIFIVVLTAAVVLLAVVPPLVPLTSLQLKVENRLQDFLGRPVHIGALRFRALPLPAFTAEELVVGRDAATGGPPLLASASVSAGLDLPALVRGRIAVDTLVFTKPRLATAAATDGFTPAGLLSLVPGLAEPAAEVKSVLADIPGSVMSDASRRPPFVAPGSRFTVKIVDGDVRFAGVPGLADDLQLQDVAVRYTYDPAHSGGSMFRGEGSCLGGRFNADFYWHLPREEAEAAPGSLQVDGKLQLVGLLLKNLRLRLATSVPSLEISYGSGNLELEVNGHPEKGVTFNCQASLNDLVLERQLPAEKQRLVQNLSFELVGGGYLAIKSNYINLKSVRFKLPGGAAVFSKGLIKYGDRLVLDLLNDVKVPKLEVLAARLPALPGALAFLAGDCSGKVNVIGNLADNPVLRLDLSSQHLSLVKPGREGFSATAGSGSEGADRDVQGGCSPLKIIERLLAWSIDSDWLAEVHCRVDKLDLCPASFSGVELVGKKLINQLEVEKLAGRTAGGDMRLSLVVDDLLHDPLWNTSLVVKKVRLEEILPAWPLSGEVDGSLVLGGEAPAVDGASSSSWLKSIRGRGVVTVAEGAFKPHRLTRSFFGFSRLLGLQPDDFLAPFNRLRLPLKIAAGTCRLKKVDLEAPWYSFRGGGSLGLDGGSLFLGGVLSYGRPGETLPPGRSFPGRRKLSARGKPEALVWQ